jgi:hypothetical protein
VFNTCKHIENQNNTTDIQNTKNDLQNDKFVENKNLTNDKNSIENSHEVKIHHPTEDFNLQIFNAEMEKQIQFIEDNDLIGNLKNEQEEEKKEDVSFMSDMSENIYTNRVMYDENEANHMIGNIQNDEKNDIEEK